jgi:hypothetical protein
VLKIPVAHLADRLAVPQPVALLGWIFTARRGRQFLTRIAARLVWREGAVLADRKPARAVLGITILNQVGLSARGLHAQAEAPQLGVPDEDSPFSGAMSASIARLVSFPMIPDPQKFWPKNLLPRRVGGARGSTRKRFAGRSQRAAA